MRSSIAVCLSVLALAGSISSCKQSDPKASIQRRKAGAQNDSALERGTANLNLTFSADQLARFFVGTENLTYRLTYMRAALSGSVSFDGSGRSVLALRDLPNDQSADLVLEIYENTALKVAGKFAATKLKSGDNSLAVTEFTTDGVDINAGWNGKSLQGNHLWKVDAN